MTILTINGKGSIKLPNDVIRHLKNAKHVHVRVNAHGITLTPVKIEPAASLQAIPSSK